MTREEAIKILKVWLFKGIDGMTNERLGYLEGWFHKEDEEAFNMAIEALEWHWIPVSERLPKEFESVLVCYKSQGGIAQCVAERLVNMDGSNRWSAMCGQEPIAWMPLPKPYKTQKGHWEFDEKGYFSCSECKRKPKDQTATTDFCPKCGADMREGEINGQI